MIEQPAPSDTIAGASSLWGVVHMGTLTVGSLGHAAVADLGSTIMSARLEHATYEDRRRMVMAIPLAGYGPVPRRPLCNQNILRCIKIFLHRIALPEMCASVIALISARAGNGRPAHPYRWWWPR